VLLDTNAMIWFVTGAARLRPAMNAQIADPDLPVSVSIVSFWEMAIKHRKGKLQLPAPFATDPDETFANWCARAVIDIVPMTARHIARAMRLDFDHSDPFDRLIAATALIENMPLVTSDAEFAACPGLRVVQV
jgi:PIN domain nuclease of toxin-antitoxin system